MLRFSCFVFSIAVIADAVLVAEEETGKTWVIIVASSMGWTNYRHQADACHAYQIVKKNGIPQEQIVTMMYDDIAHNVENPTPGNIINRPGGPDVYEGVKIDYRRDAVTPKNFLNALSGGLTDDGMGGKGKVIKSGPNDRIFVNLVDHGAPGLVAFPDQELHATEWIQTLKKMHEQHKFKEMVIYLEACESGSMFNSLLKSEMNVFAVTASNSHESSYAIYFDEKRETYLGDVFSVKWMENSDSVNLNRETIKKQFSIVKRETNTSHVEEFGKMDISKEELSAFQAGSPKLAEDVEVSLTPPTPGWDAVPARDVPLKIMEYKMQHAKTLEEFEKYTEKHTALVQNKNKMTQLFAEIINVAVEMSFKQSHADLVSRVTGEFVKDIEMGCYSPVLITYMDNCRPLNRVNEAYQANLFQLSNLCAEGLPSQVIQEAVVEVCSKWVAS